MPTSLVVKGVSVNALKSLEGKNRQNCKKNILRALRRMRSRAMEGKVGLEPI